MHYSLHTYLERAGIVRICVRGVNKVMPGKHPASHKEYSLGQKKKINKTSLTMT